MPETEQTEDETSDANYGDFVAGFLSWTVKQKSDEENWLRLAHLKNAKNRGS
jgi:hypothetical protein